MSNQEFVKPKSKSSRIRASMVQFFTGSFWSPPESTKRVRRPPSQWWNPTGSLGKSDRKSDKSITVDVEVFPNVTLLIRQIPGNKETEENQEASIVRKIISSQVYDFSD